MGRIIIILINLYVIYLGFGWGVSVGEGWTEGKYTKWSNQVKQAYTHTITIYWNENMTDYSTISVREDTNWTISGAYGYDSLYSTSNPAPSEMNLTYALSGHIPEGKTVEDFAGLWTSAYGGSQYLNSAGYSLYNVKNDVTLFAIWE